MASSKEIQQSSRPLTHRPSLSNVSNGASTLASNAPKSHARAGSHSIIGAALNSNHRVGRRKSMTSSGGTNVAAMAALIQEADVLPNGGVAVGTRRNALSKAGPGTISGSFGVLPRGTNAMAAAMATAGTNGLVGSLPLPSPPASLPTRKFVTADGSAIEDDPNDMSDGEVDPTSLTDANAIAFEAARVRRASDGQPLIKEGRRSSRMELRCQKCGKGYKHSSCLTKHLWEHTPEWSLTSKLLISKHQQVQLLEAASVLVAMNHKPGAAEADSHANAAVSVTTPPDSTRDSGSERGSASPAASGHSDDPSDDRSSADTTPPPLHIDGAMNIGGIKREVSANVSSPPQRLNFPQRSGGISRSYQSGLSAGGAGTGLGSGHQRQASRDNLRPPSSGKNTTGQEDNELAAAVELLSCSFNSAAGDGSGVAIGSIHSLGKDVPPVPPVPAQYLGQSATPLGDTSFINSFPSRAPESFTRGTRHRLSIVGDVKMEGSNGGLMDEEDDDMRSRGRSEDDEDGVFGRMEE